MAKMTKAASKVYQYLYDDKKLSLQNLTFLPVLISNFPPHYVMKRLEKYVLVA